MKCIQRSLKVPFCLSFCITQLVLGLASFSTYAQVSPKPYANSTSVNSVQAWNVNRPLTTSSSITSNTNPSEVMLSTSYMDGLGRTVQVVTRKASPLQKDLASVTAYDTMGRSSLQFLPFTSTSSDGSFKSNAFGEQKTFDSSYFLGQNQTWFYGITKFEASPLGRVQETFAPGNSWAGTSGQSLEDNRHSVKAKYFNVTATDNVFKWTVNDGVAGTFGTYTIEGSYAAGSLFKQIITDEQNKQVIIFYDEQGHILLKKMQNTSLPDLGAGKSNAGWMCTYFIYDERFNLRCIAQPEAVKSLTGTIGEAFSATVLTEQCFRYEYDSRSRLILKKKPGKAKSESVYDNRNRLVMSRDSSLAMQGYWLVNKYDALNRLTQNYLILNNLTRARNQDSCANNINYPAVSSSDLMQENYYDNYNFAPQTWISATLATGDIYSAFFITTYNTAPDYAQQVAASYYRCVGKQTGMKVRVLGTSTYLYSANFYDINSQLIQTQSQNYAGGYDIITMQYDFGGKVLRRLHRAAKSTPVGKFTVELTKFSYDHAGRVKTITKKVSSSGTDKAIASYAYDENGNLEQKTVGSSLTDENYDYNIRGWVLGMNRSSFSKGSQPTSLFSYELAYDNVTPAINPGSYGTAQYNGNISGMMWQSIGDWENRKYNYNYDTANRLIKADFTQFSNANNIFNLEAAIDFSIIIGDGIHPDSAYDLNGNMKHMVQKGFKVTNSILVDDMRYTYQTGSNRLARVTDAGTDPNAKMGDFKDGVNLDDDYNYDVNGNLTADKNKGVSTILYNHLNLPYEVRMTGKGKITYTYDNLGRKLKKVVVDSTASPVKTTTWQYIQNYTYKNDTLESFTHEEGRARYDSTEITGEATKFNYDYFVKDHLGNVRMVLTDKKDTTIYWPLSFEGTVGSNDQIMQDKIWENKTGTSININSVRTARPGSFGTAGSNGSYAMLVRKSTGSIGAAKLLKVMAGDRIHTQVDYFYTTTNANNSGADGIGSLLANLATSMAASGQVSSVLKGGASSLTSALSGSTNLINWLSTPNNTSGANNAPKAYLNILFFDEQFKPDNVATIVIPVGYSPNMKGTINKMWANAVAARQNGYVYVYFSNESDELVYFDNFVVTHELSSLREENHYYPFGLQMSAISSRALLPTFSQNKRMFNDGRELQNKEFSDGSGWEMYETGYRSYDPQIGRFNQIDPIAAAVACVSPYAYANNNPVYWNDPSGLQVGKPQPTTAPDVDGIGYGGGGSGGGGNPYYHPKPPGPIQFPGSGTLTLQEAIDAAMASPFGGTIQSSNGGWKERNYGDEQEVFSEAAAYADYFNSWGTNGTSTRGSFEAEFASKFDVPLLTSVYVKGFYKQGKWQTTNSADVNNQLRANGAFYLDRGGLDAAAAIVGGANLAFETTELMTIGTQKLANTFAGTKSEVLTAGRLGKTVGKAFLVADVALTFADAYVNDGELKRHHIADIGISGIIYGVAEISGPVGWILGGAYFLGNEWYKSEHEGRSITEDLWDD
jgi:RHS repeat-associated protein